MGFQLFTFASFLGGCKEPRVTDLVVKEGHLNSQLNIDEVLRYIVLQIECQNQCQYKTWFNNDRTHLTRIFRQNNAVCIDWPVRSSDVSTIEHV